MAFAIRLPDTRLASAEQAGPKAYAAAVEELLATYVARVPELGGTVAASREQARASSGRIRYPSGTQGEVGSTGTISPD